MTCHFDPLRLFGLCSKNMKFKSIHNYFIINNIITSFFIMPPSTIAAFSAAGKGMRKVVSFQRCSSSTLDLLASSSSMPDSSTSQSYLRKSISCGAISSITSNIYEKVKTLASALVSLLLCIYLLQSYSIPFIIHYLYFFLAECHIITI